MKYEDVLAACLDRLRRGESIDALVAQNASFTDQLRFDLTAAASTRRVSAGLPATSDAARVRFQRDLQEQRRVVAAAPAKQRGGWLRFSFALPAMAATAAALLVAAVLVTGVVAPTNTAEAAIEGVVVENNGSTLTVQTEEGLRSVTLADSATIRSDETGSALELISLEPGQLILIRGRQQAAAVVAQRIELRNAAEFPNWCQRLPDQCAELERALSEGADRCQQNAVLCARIRARLQEIRSEIDSKRQITDLQRRCEAGAAIACRELQNSCQSDRPVCRPVGEFLRNRQR